MTGIPDRVQVAAFAYIALPAMVFVAGWLEPAASIVLVVITGRALLSVFRTTSSGGDLPRTLGAALWLLLLALAWSALGGAGHLVYANPDWHTRDAVFADLILTPWPPIYATGSGAELILRSATGFYLVPAAIAKLTGMSAASWLLYGWSAMGTFLFLALLPLPRTFSARLVALSLIAVGFSGMDYLGILIAHGHAPIYPLSLEWWQPWTYTSLTAQLFWAPNHALPLWIGCLLLFHSRDRRDLPGLVLVLLPLLFLWSPFAIGLLPWALLFLAQQRKPLGLLVLTTKGTQWAFATLFTTLLVAYFSLPGIEKPQIAVGALASATSKGQSSWSEIDTLRAYVQFVAFEFLIVTLLLRPRNGAFRQMLTLALLVLLLLPFIRIGPSNDLLLRISTPCLVILLVLALDELDRPASELLRNWRTGAICVVLAIGFLTPTFEVGRSLAWKRTPPNYGQTLLEAQDGYPAPHYLGKFDLLPLQWIFKVPHFVQSRPGYQYRRPP